MVRDVFHDVDRYNKIKWLSPKMKSDLKKGYYYIADDIIVVHRRPTR